MIFIKKKAVHGIEQYNEWISQILLLQLPAFDTRICLEVFIAYKHLHYTARQSKKVPHHTTWTHSFEYNCSSTWCVGTNHVHHINQSTGILLSSQAITLIPGKSVEGWAQLRLSINILMTDSSLANITLGLRKYLKKKKIECKIWFSAS